MDEPPGVLAFTDIKVDGVLPVGGADGKPVATIRRSQRMRMQFEATLPDGTLLCTGRGPAVGRTYAAYDATGAALARVTPGLLGGRTLATLYRSGQVGQVRGYTFTRRWEVLDVRGEPLLTSLADPADEGPQPRDNWLISNPGRLMLAEVVAVVELNRMRIRNARTATRARLSDRPRLF